MKILVTGATGYIGKRLIPILLQKGHNVICAVRNVSRWIKYDMPEGNITPVEIDFLDSPENYPEIEADAAYYLIHSMSSSLNEFREMEERTARNFKQFAVKGRVRQVIYLSGIANENELSEHLQSRKNTEDILKSDKYSLTVLRAGIIVGSGSASFEIIRDLVEKLPFMITPKWLNTKIQPIAIRDVLKYLVMTIENPEFKNRTLDIGGPDIMTYKEMLMGFAEVRQLKRMIITLPVMTPRLSSYWLYFVTSVSYKLAVNLVKSMKIEVVCRDNTAAELSGFEHISYKDSVKLAFTKIENHEVPSSWKDSLVSSSANPSFMNRVSVPRHGCFKDIQSIRIIDREKTIQNIFSIGGDNGWYYLNFLWSIRGFLDKLLGGVGLRRGRTDTEHISSGDALDFWRVLYADKQAGRLLLYAEMKLPGEAWLEFRIEGEGKRQYLVQEATFRPKGLSGRMYWYSMLPFHFFVFSGMAAAIASEKN